MPSGLHEGIADGRSDEIEAALLQVFTHGIRFGRARRNSPQRPPRVHARLALHELPHVAVEAAEFLLHAQQRLRILAPPTRPLAGCGRCRDCSTAARPCVGRIVRRARGSKPSKARAIVFTLVEDRVPAQSGLRAFENEEFKERAVVVHWDAPFLIVIADRLIRCSPRRSEPALGEFAWLH